MEKKWNEKTTTEKVATVISAVAFCVWLLFEWLERAYSLEYANFVSCISVCIICVCEAISFWNVKRGLSYVGIGGAVCMIAVLILEVI